MTSLLLPDVNVWVALHHRRHSHHSVALEWFNSLDLDVVLVFCRQSQLGMFRLLTSENVMGNETIPLRQCWEIYEQWLGSGRAIEKTEPAGILGAFRARTCSDEPSPKTWTDSYLAAFAETAGLTLVTFDKALAARTKRALLLQ
jgi:uncharacterized protein